MPNAEIRPDNALHPADGIRAVLFEQSTAARAPWFAILDAAQDPVLPGHAAEYGLRVESLYAGRLGAMLDCVAPYLAQFDFGIGFVDSFCGLWHKSVGILVQSSVDFQSVRKHLRQFLMVKDEAGKKYRFRFYDPRVLRAFLPACSSDELVQFFGPIERFYAPTRDGNAVLSFSLRDGRLRAAQLK